MADIESEQIPDLVILPLLRVTANTAARALNDYTDVDGLPVYDTCTCGTYDYFEFVDVAPDHHFDLPDALRGASLSLTLGILHDSPGFFEISQIVKRGECPLCTVLFREYGPPENFLPSSLIASMVSTFHNFWSTHSARARVKDVYSRIDHPYTPWVFGCLSNSTGVYEPQTVSTVCDLTHMKSWIRNCMTQHAGCYTRDCVVEGMRLIDCQEHKICRAKPYVRWIALSYVWGKPTPTKPSQDTPEFPSNVPQTIKDAMTVTVELGYRYLWVDAYCINQSHGAHKADQISKMDRIYRGAEFTIVAPGYDKTAGLYGVSVRRKPDHKLFRMQVRDIFFAGEDPSLTVKRSKWWSRGWTFQEGYLSNRLLVFGEQQVSFYCNTSSWKEHLSGPESVEDQSMVDWDLWSANDSLHEPPGSGVGKDEAYNSYERFTRLLAQYNERTLSFDSDALNAFTGIARHLQATARPTYSFAGLPYIPWTDIEAREKLVGLALVFLVDEAKGISERRPAFPSWTWAGWTGPACWTYERRHNLDDICSTMSDVLFESSSPQNAIVAIQSNPSQKFLDGVHAVHFEARVTYLEHISFVSSKVTIYKYVKGWCTVTEAGMLDNLAKGIWSCLLIGYERISSVKGSPSLLFVEWQYEETAVRLGTVRSWDLSIEPRIMDTLPRRKVRLI